MTVDVVNQQNEKVGTLDVDERLLAESPAAHLIWESVVRQNASERRGTAATRTRGMVSGSGRKPWRQKGTGRARVGETRNPLWRKGGTVFGPQPRSYEYRLPRKVEIGALRAALVQKLKDGALVVVDSLVAESGKTKDAAELFRRLGVEGRTLVVDVRPDDTLRRAVRNLAGVRVAASSRITARDVVSARRLVASRAAIERLQEVVTR